MITIADSIGQHMPDVTAALLPGEPLCFCDSLSGSWRDNAAVLRARFFQRQAESAGRRAATELLKYLES